MRRFFFSYGLLAVLLALAGCVAPQEKPLPLVKATVLPLALNDAFEFRKTKLFYNGLEQPRSVNEMISFQERRVNFGAVDTQDVLERKGNYFTFFWRAHRESTITVRLEYRTANLGDYVQAREITYPEAKGSHRTQFAITGDSFVDDGRITAWRALLIEDGKIVALNQSMLWN